MPRLARGGGAPYVGAMRRGDRNLIVIGRLRGKPLLAGQLLCAIAIAGLVVRQAGAAWGDGAAAVIRHILTGNLIVTALIMMAAVGLWHFIRLWRRRGAWIAHDGARLYRGDESWPLPLIRDVVVAPGAFGIASLRLVVDDDSEVTRALVPLRLLDGSVEAVRGGVMFAVSGLRGFPGGSPLN